MLHYHTGDTVQRATLLHYGQTDVVADLDGWFHTYNGRQTTEAGIKEGKNVLSDASFEGALAGSIALAGAYGLFCGQFRPFCRLVAGPNRAADALFDDIGQANGSSGGPHFGLGAKAR